MSTQLKKHILNKCPICGGRLYLDVLYQYSKVYPVARTGTPAYSKVKKRDNGPMECSAIYCENEDFRTDYEGYKVTEPAGSGIKITVENDKFYYTKENEDE